MSTSPETSSPILDRLANLLSGLKPFSGHSPSALRDALSIPPQRKIGSVSLDLSKLGGADRPATAALAKELAGAGGIASCVAVFPRLYFDLRRPVAVELLEEALADGRAGWREENRGKLINLSFCSPNTNKSLHLGHARNMFLGMAISRMLERAGYEVFRTCNYSDTGVHIMKAYAAFQRLGSGAELQGLPADVVAARCYQTYETSPGDFADPQELLDRSHQPGSPLFDEVRAWTDGVIACFEETFRQYGVSFHWTLRESENLPWIDGILRTLAERGSLRHQENGDAFVEIPWGDKAEKVFLRRRGGSPLYMSQLLSSGVRRIEYFGSRLERIYALAGAEQKEVFDQLHRVQERYGIPCAERYRYFDFGLVFTDGVRLRSRETNVYSLDKLGRTLLPKVSELFAGGESGISPEEYGRAHIVHFFLKKERQQSLDFRQKEIEEFGRGSFWDLCRAFRELTKIAAGEGSRSLRGSAEEPVLQALLRYPAVVESAVDSLDPAILVRFGLKLADACETSEGGSPGPWSARLAGVAARVLGDSARLCNLDLEKASIFREPPIRRLFV